MNIPSLSTQNPIFSLTDFNDNLSHWIMYCLSSKFIFITTEKSNKINILQLISSVFEIKCITLKLNLLISEISHQYSSFHGRDVMRRGLRSFSVLFVVPSSSSLLYFCLMIVFFLSIVFLVLGLFCFCFTLDQGINISVKTDQIEDQFCKLIKRWTIFINKRRTCLPAQRNVQELNKQNKDTRIVRLMAKIIT